MRTINQIILCGNLGKDVEIKNTKSGFKVAYVSLATTKKVKEELRTQWHKVVCFAEQASCVEHAKKGDKVMIVGEIEYQKYQDKDGHERTSTSIIATHACVMPKLQEKQPTAYEAIAQSTDFYNIAQNNAEPPRHYLRKETDLTEELPF